MATRKKQPTDVRSASSSPPRRKAPARTKAVGDKPTRTRRTSTPAADGAAPAGGRGKHDLVIVESPAKAKTINKYLGSDYKVLASYGHVRDLPKRRKKGETVAGVNIDDGWVPTYEVV